MLGLSRVFRAGLACLESDVSAPMAAPLTSTHFESRNNTFRGLFRSRNAATAFFSWAASKMAVRDLEKVERFGERRTDSSVFPRCSSTDSSVSSGLNVPATRSALLTDQPWATLS